MTYEIEIEYVTGNSFGNEERTETVGCIWEDLETAKLALSYIKEHYHAVRRCEEAKGPFSLEEYLGRPWFSTEYWDSTVILPTDAGRVQRVDAFWEGYFERLVSARVILDNGMTFTP